MNIVPRDGGNTFSGAFNTSHTTPSLQADNLNDELRARGLDKGLAERASANARTTEVDRAREVWRRKFRDPGKTREERAKQMRFLQSRGFSFDAIRTVVRGADED